MAAYSDDDDERVMSVLHVLLPPRPVENKRLTQMEPMSPADKLISMIDLTVIGRKTKFLGPFGERQVVYCDYAASGRSLNLIEQYIMEQVLPLYSNIRTNTTVNSKQTLLYRQEARDIIRNAVNACQRDAVIFVGSESTAPVQKLIQSLKLHVETPPVVFVGPFQPDSNLTPWTEIGSEIVRIQENAQGFVDMECLETNLQKWQVTDRRLIGYFSAASNITGILSDDVAITVMLHRYGARAFWDFTSAGPHININMNPPDTEGNRQVSAYKDAIFLSPAMLIGGVESPGVLIAKRSLFQNVVQNDDDDRPHYINHWDHCYMNDIEMREEGGMQSVVGAVRAGLAFQLKEAVGTEYIVAREQEVSKKVLSSWSDCPNLVLLGNTAVPRLPIFSFLIRHPSTKQFLHHNFVCAVLNDVFGIQASEGCACAGRYVQDLLGFDEELAKKFEASSLLEDRPGFTCISLPYFMDSASVDFVIQAVCMMAKHAWKLLPQYVLNAETGEWTQKNCKLFPDQRSLTSISYSDGKMTYSSPARNQANKHTHEDCLKGAQNIFKSAEKMQTLLPERSIQSDSKTSALRWFMLPSEALTLLKKPKPCHWSLLMKVPFEPKDYKTKTSLNEGKVNGKDETSVVKKEMEICISERPYTCSYCDKTFTLGSALKRHMKTHTGGRPYACSHCDETFTLGSALKKHMRTHTGKRPYACSYCDKTFTESGNLNAHMRIHTGERPYACSHCDKTFIQSSHLKIHIKTHTGERPYACIHCDKTFKRRRNMKAHMRLHTGERPYACIHCDKTYTLGGSLKKHMESHTRNQPYACIHCDKTFTQGSALKTHMRTHTGERPFACSHCDKTYTLGDSLMNHMKRHTGERPFACKHCDKTFIWGSAFRKHIRIHTVERPFACSHCDKTFTANFGLTVHMRTHTGERPYACSQCDKTFRQNVKLMSHMRTHTVERPHE